MSEPTLQLPSELKYGYVEAQIILAVADTAADPDRLPDAQPASGTITLTPVESKRLYTESGPPVLVGKHAITGTLDSHGRLRDSQGGLGICVVVGQYNVSYSLQGISVDSHPILVTEAHTKDDPLNLVDLVTFDPPATPGQFELLNARIDAESAIDKAPVVVLTNPEEIPTDVAGRIDLVFTEPTTVHFQSPVRTDIVVSIEGYEHITWDGVVVHGTPKTSEIVWASALWRDRDLSWHLLCEQSTGTGAGGSGNVTIEEFTYSVPFISPKMNEEQTDYAFAPSGLYEIESTVIGEQKAHEIVTTTVHPSTGNTVRTVMDRPESTMDGIDTLRPFDFGMFMVGNAPVDGSSGWMLQCFLNVRGGKYSAQVVLYLFPNSIPQGENYLVNIGVAQYLPEMGGPYGIKIPIEMPGGGTAYINLQNYGGSSRTSTFQYNNSEWSGNPPIPEPEFNEDMGGAVHALEMEIEGNVSRTLE